MMKTEYFADKYESEQDFCWEGLFSQECFSIFWKYCPDIFEDIISQAKYEFDHTIIHNEHQYQGNLRKYSTLFPYFSSQVKSEPDAMVSVSDENSEETFSLFLGCLHGIKSIPQEVKKWEFVTT